MNAAVLAEAMIATFLCRNRPSRADYLTPADVTERKLTAPFSTALQNGNARRPSEDKESLRPPEHPTFSRDGCNHDTTQEVGLATLGDTFDDLAKD